MRLLSEHISGAYRTLRRTRARTVLTTLGIAIGVASVRCILAISDGVTRMFDKQISHYNGRLIVVRPGIQSRDPNMLLSAMSQQMFGASTLTDADVDAVAKTQHVQSVAPLMTLNATITAKGQTAKNNVVLATTPGFAKISDADITAGQFLGEETKDTTAVIGDQLSIKLFNTDSSVGQVFTMHGQRFTVIGVMKQKTSAVNYNNIDYGNTVIVSYDQGKQLLKGNTQIQQIDVLVDEAKSSSGVVAELKNKINKLHLGEEDFSILTGREIGQPTNQLFTALIATMAAIAAISLVVGGIGIMNIMLVGVAERTREIGIRKAVGASHRNIIGQFMVESMMISILGGIIGYIGGYVLAFIASTFLYFSPAFTLQTALMAVLMAVGVGVVFGTYPAVKAARKDTIESLRQYH